MSLEPEDDNFMRPDLDDECSDMNDFNTEMDDEFQSFVSESAGDQIEFDEDY